MLRDSGYFLWVTLSAAIICLVSLLVLMAVFPGSATNFESETAATFAALQECLSASLYRVGARETRMEVSYYRQLYNQLLQRSIKLNESYSQAAFELRLGRLSRMCHALCCASNLSHYSAPHSPRYSSVYQHRGTLEARAGLGPGACQASS